MTSNARPDALQAFLDAFRRGVEGASPGSETRACLSRVFERLQDPVPVTDADPVRVPASALLEHSLEPARRAEGGLEDLQAIRERGLRAAHRVSDDVVVTS